MSKARRRGGAYPQKVRCKATNRWGDQCHKWAMKGSVVCNKHGGAAPQVRAKAQERIAMAQDDAASLLIKFMGDKSVPYGERRRCAEFLLNYEDRNKVQVTLDKWQQGLDSIVVEIGDDEVVEAEIVDDDELTAQPLHPSLPRGEDSDRLPALSEDPPRYGRGNRLQGR